MTGLYLFFILVSILFIYLLIRTELKNREKAVEKPIEVKQEPIPEVKKTFVTYSSAHLNTPKPKPIIQPEKKPEEETIEKKEINSIDTAFAIEQYQKVKEEQEKQTRFVPTQEIGSFSEIYSCAGYQYNAAPKIKHKLFENDELRLVPQPDNNYNPNAIMIYWNRNKIGYIPDEYCEELADMINDGVVLKAKIYRLDWYETSYHKIKINVWAD